MTDRGSPRVLVIGARVPGVPCARWFEGKLPNIADYDLLVANSLSLEAEMEKVPDGGNLSFEAHKHWTKRLEEIRERTRKLLKSGGQVVAIVGKEVIRVTESKPDQHFFPGFISSLDWMPVPVGLERESGDTVKSVVPQFERYMSLVARWDYHLVVDEERMTRPDRRSELRSEHDAKQITVNIEPVAVNRQDDPIAAAYSYGVHGGDWKTPSRHVEMWSGPFVVLPPPTAVDSIEALRLILEDVARVEFADVPEPEWLADIQVVGESEQLEEIATLEAEQDALGSRIRAMNDQRQERRRFLTLLSGTGMELQMVARDAFEECGFVTRDIDPEISDEFVVGRGEDEFIVEVKGHRQSAQAADVRQLDEAMDKYQRAIGKPIKGVLLVNAWREVPPSSREGKESRSFPDNINRRADAIGVTLISGNELFGALQKHWAGELGADEIFRTIFNSTGAVSF